MRRTNPIFPITLPPITTSGRKPRQRAAGGAAAAIVVAAMAGGASADTWKMSMTVDNQYAAYYGTATATSGLIGSDNNWQTLETWTVTGRSASDYLYVATASDQATAQGFLGNFQNTTLGTSILTGDSRWEVFPAGKYASALGWSTSTWPVKTQPTQTQVDAAIAYATSNGLWVAPSGAPGYDNDPSTGTGGFGWPWLYYSPTGPDPVPLNTEWIWYDSGRDKSASTLYPPSPLHGFNHDEFLVFRIAGVPAPGSMALLGLGGVVAGRRRRAGAA